MRKNTLGLIVLLTSLSLCDEILNSAAAVNLKNWIPKQIWVFIMCVYFPLQYLTITWVIVVRSISGLRDMYLLLTHTYLYNKSK